MDAVAVPAGPWQVVTLAAALETVNHPTSSVVLVLPYTDRELLEATVCVADKCGPWGAVVGWPVHGQPYERKRRFETEVLKNLDLKRVDRFWVGRMGDNEAIAAQILRPDTLLVHEDGLHTYLAPGVPSSRSARGAPLRFARRLGAKIFSSRATQPRMARLKFTTKPTEGALVLREILGDPPWSHGRSLKTIPTEVLRSIIDRVRDIERDPWRGMEKGPTVVILGQCFSLWNSLSFEVEERITRRVVAAVKVAGYRAVWKPHPRLDVLANAREDDGEPDFRLPSRGLIEALLPISRSQIIGVAGVSSSSLFYLSKLFHIPTFTLAGEFLPFLDSDQAEMARIVAQHVRPLTELLRAPELNE